MSKTNVLFQLIKSLSRGEKRNFKLLTQLTGSEKSEKSDKGKKNYLKLFDAIDKQEKYNEKELRQQFKGEAFIKQFSVAKNYLFNSIIKSLAYYYKGSYAESASRAVQIQILMDRHLYDQAYRRLNKALYDAEERFDFLDLIRLRDLESKMIRGTSDFDRQKVRRLDVRKKILEATSKLSNFVHYSLLIDQTFEAYEYRFDQKKKWQEMLKEVVEDELMQSPDCALTPKAEIFYHRLHFYCKQYLPKAHQKVNNIAEILRIFEQHPKLKEELEMCYVEALTNEVYTYSQSDDPKHRAIMRKKSEAFYRMQFRSVTAESKKVLCYFLANLNDAISYGETEAGFALTRRMEGELAALRGIMLEVDHLRLANAAANLNFASGDFSAALRWSNKVINGPDQMLQASATIAARILNLLIHFELGNYDLLETRMKSFARFVSKKRTNRKLANYDKVVIRTLSALLRAMNKQAETAIFEKLRREMDMLSRDPNESEFVRHLDLKAWAISKLENISFGMAMRREKEKRNLRAQILKEEKSA